MIDGDEMETREEGVFEDTVRQTLFLVFVSSRYAPIKCFSFIKNASS